MSLSLLLIRAVGGFCKLPSIALMLVVACPSFAQIMQVERFELEQKGIDPAWTLISLKEEGLAIVRDRDKFDSGNKQFEIHILDTLLKEKTKIEIGIPHRMTLIGYEYTPGHLYTLFRAGENDLADMLLVKMDLATSDIERFDIKHQFNIRLTHFIVVDGRAIFGGYVTREPAITIFDTNDKQLKVLPGFFTQDTELLDVRTNQNGTFNTLTANRSIRQNNRTLHLRTFDATGVQLMDDEIPVDNNKTILSGLTSALVRDELLIAGTYSTGNSKMATGFFSVLADPFKEQPIHYYDFAQLNHFLDYVTNKRAEKIKESSRRDREKSKDPEFKVNVSNVRLEERPTGFYLLAEAYNSVTATNAGPYPYSGGSAYQGYYNPYFSPYGYSPYSQRYYNSPFNYNQQTPNNVMLLSTSVVAFNPDGRLDWDHSLKVNDERRAALEQGADFWCDRNKIVIATKSESDLVVKARFKNNEYTGDTLKVLMNKPTETVKDETDDDGGVRHWYQNKMYVWGYHTVKDPQRVEDRTRSVFYIIKINAY
jgi:hypothetical protein